MLEIHSESMSKQREILDKTIIDWKGDNTQIDDILVIGFKVDFSETEDISLKEKKKVEEFAI